MSFFKRAWLAVRRRKARTIIMFVILTAISTLIFTGLAVQNATKEASILARQKLGSTLTLTFDSEKAMQKQMEAEESMQNRKVMFDIEYEAVTEEMTENIAKSEHIYDYNYIVNITGFADGFDAITDSKGQQMKEAENNIKDKIDDFNSSVSGMRTRGNMPQGMEKIDMANIVMADITITGVSASDLDENFDSGAYSIVEGEKITPVSVNNAVLIEETLAEANEISVGETIKIKATSSGESIELLVVGIYNGGENQQGSMFSGMSSSLVQNKIYVRFDKAVEIKQKASAENENTENTPFVRGATNSSDGIDSVIFYVDDPENIEEVISFAEDTDVDLETFKLSANDEEYESMIKPIENVASFSKILVIIVIAAGAMIISLILMLWIKERTYETGVLLSLGESKIKVVLQYATEVLVIFIIGFTLSVFIGTGISQKVGDVLLSQEIEAIQNVNSNEPFDMQNMNISRQPAGGKGFDRENNKMMEAEVIDEIDVHVSLPVILQVFGLGMLLVFISTVIPVIYVLRYNPKQILTNAG